MVTRPRRRLGRKCGEVAALVREMIASGALAPGAAVPSAAALARETGYHAQTCMAALRALAADGTLTPGVTPGGRLRVTQPGGSRGPGPEALRAALSRSLAARRRAAGLTQPELAEKIGMSGTAVGHAETGRLWQSREFWHLVGAVLGGDGELPALYDRYQAARHAEAGVPAEATPTVTITGEGVLITWPDGTMTLARPPGAAARSAGTEARDDG